MTGVLPRPNRGAGASPDCWSQALRSVTHSPFYERSRQLFTPTRTTHTAPTNNKAADPVEASATTTTAATGLPPVPHERAAVIVARRCPFRHGAHRLARYKVDLARRAARTVRGASCERDTRLQLRHAEGAGVLMLDLTRKLDHASQFDRGAPASRSRCPRLGPARTACLGIARGDAPPNDGRRCGVCARAGVRSSRGSTHAPARTTTVRPDPRDFGPTARPARATDDGDAASARGDLAGTRRSYLGAATRAGAISSRVVVRRQMI